MRCRCSVPEHLDIPKTKSHRKADAAAKTRTENNMMNTILKRTECLIHAVKHVHKRYSEQNLPERVYLMRDTSRRSLRKRRMLTVEKKQNFPTILRYTRSLIFREEFPKILLTPFLCRLANRTVTKRSFELTKFHRIQVRISSVEGALWGNFLLIL